MKRFRINRYGLYNHIFDVEMKRWYGWTLIKRFKGTPLFHDNGKYSIDVAKMLAEELLEKLEK